MMAGYWNGFSYRRYIGPVICLLEALAGGGCAALPHLEEALRLKEFSEEKEAQERYVAAHDARFNALLRQLQEPEPFKQFGHKQDIVKAFGPPVLCGPDGGREKCLYRRIVKPGESPKVYFYFGDRGELVRWVAP